MDWKQGSPCVDQGEKRPLHGTIGNLPAEQANWLEEDDSLVMRAVIKDEVIFSRKLRMHREIRVSLTENQFVITARCFQSKTPQQATGHLTLAAFAKSRNVKLLFSFTFLDLAHCSRE